MAEVMEASESDVDTEVVPQQTETERLTDQKKKFFSIMAEAFDDTSDRYIKLVKLYDDYGDRLLESPASGKIHYHNAYAGGYIDHVLHVHDCALMQARLLMKMGGWVDFSRSELVMATLHHDLWKLGMPGGEPYYLVETSDWHRKNQGSMFKHNERLPFFNVTDGAIFLLQKYGIELSYNEWMGIKMSDGLYDESNKKYLMNYGKFAMHTSLGYVVHWADHMSTTAERDPLRQEFMDSLTEE